jgi:hypothetical protein
VLDPFEAAALDAIGRTVAATVRDQVFELVEKDVRYPGGRDIAAMLRGWLVDNSGRAFGTTCLAIRVHFAGLPMNLIGGQGGKP